MFTYGIGTKNKFAAKKSTAFFALAVAVPSLVALVLGLAGCHTVIQSSPGGVLKINVSQIQMPAHCAATFTFSATGGSAPYFYHVLSGPGAFTPSTGIYTATGAGVATIIADDVQGNTGQATVVTYWSPTNDAIKAVAQDSLGNTYLGGTFTRACPNMAPNAFFANASTAAPDYRANLGLGFDGPVYASVQLSDGSIVVGGNFTHYNGAAAPYLAKIDVFGNFDSTFTPAAGPNAAVTTLVADSSNNIFVGGQFTTFNGSALHAYLVKVSSSGAVDATFNAGVPNSNVNKIALDGSGNLYGVGPFSSYAGTPAANIFKVNASTGGLDTTFMTGVTSSFSSAPLTLIADSAAHLYVGGSFTSYNGTGVNLLVRLSTTSGALDGTFVANLPGTGQVNAIAVDGGGVYAVGTFVSGSSAGISKMNLDGTTNSTFATGSGTGFAGAISATSQGLVAKLDGNGNLFVGGNFASYNTTSSGGVVAINTTSAAINSTFAVGLGTVGAGALLGSVNDLSLLSNGDILLLGNFSGYQGYQANHIAAFDASWNILPTFLVGGGIDPGSTTAVVNALATDSADNIYVGGVFSQYRTTTVNGLAKLATATGNLVVGFASPTLSTQEVDALAVDSLGNLYVGGPFNTYNAVATDSLVQVNSSTGALITSFNSNLGAGSYLLNQSPKSLAIDTANNIYVGGTGFSVGPLGKIAVTGVPAAGFDTGGAWFTGGDSVNSLTVDAGNNVYAAGTFAQFRGTATSNIVKISSTGTMDTTFLPAAGFTGTVLTSTLDANGNLFLAGPFTQYQGAAVTHLAELSPINAALNATFETATAIDLQTGRTVTRAAASHGSTILVLTSGGIGNVLSGSTTSIFQGAVMVDSVNGGVSP